MVCSPFSRLPSYPTTADPMKQRELLVEQIVTDEPMPSGRLGMEGQVIRTQHENWHPLVKAPETRVFVPGLVGDV